MARRPKLRLTALAVSRAKALPNQKGNRRIADGDGLYLQVSYSGAKSWLYLFRWRDNPKDPKSKIKEMGLGSADLVSLADARRLATEAAQMVLSGKNPIVERRAAPAKVDEARIPTFEEYGLRMIEAWSSGWKTTKSTDPDEVDEFGNPAETNKQLVNWTRTVKTDLAFLGPKSLDSISAADVATALRPLWNKKQATADKAMQRAAKILSAAKVDGYRSGDNPAIWKGNLEHILPKVKVKVRHHPAMPWEQVPDFFAELKAIESRSSMALQLLVLTVVRTSECCHARKEEFDYDEATWTIPDHRMKSTGSDSSQDHVVPLVPRAAWIAKEMARRTTDAVPWVFGDPFTRKPLSTAAMDKLLQDTMGYADYTVHGFRSAFRDWAGDETEHEREIAELSLAHAVGDDTELAYRRARALKKRRKLLQDWAKFIDPSGASDDA